MRREGWLPGKPESDKRKVNVNGPVLGNGGGGASAVRAIRLCESGSFIAMSWRVDLASISWTPKLARMLASEPQVLPRRRMRRELYGRRFVFGWF